MKLFLDMPMPQRLATWLRSQGLDVVHARDIGFSRTSDIDILSHAAQEGRVILTMDLDFPAILAFTKANQPGVILFRMRRPAFPFVKERLELLLRIHDQRLLTSSITIVEDARIRIRKLPLP